ncbi:MAG: WbqC family protein [Bacteroidales bacterium]|nr:WbqC family protein [Bacteroidales bacterium]
MPHKLHSFSPAILLTTAYLPPIEYMAYLVRAHKVYVELHETYPRQSWRNRCRLMLANGPLDLTIPVKKPHGNHTKTADVIVSDHENWQKKHWRSIVSAYSKSPYFFYYSDLLAPLYHQPPPDQLWAFNHELLKVLCRELGIDAHVSFTDTYEKKTEGVTDLRNCFSPKAQRREAPGLSKWPFYQQVFSDRHGFVPDLSVTDLLFNTGPEARDYLIKLLPDNPDV